jgi:hypothetical protein
MFDGVGIFATRNMVTGVFFASTGIREMNLFRLPCWRYL